MRMLTIREQRKREKLQRLVDDFNRRFPVGAAVLLRTDSGDVETIVRNPAEILSGHTAVGWFEGVSGCYDIEGRVREVPVATAR